MITTSSPHNNAPANSNTPHVHKGGMRDLVPAFTYPPVKENLASPIIPVYNSPVLKLTLLEKVWLYHLLEQKKLVSNNFQLNKNITVLIPPINDKNYKFYLFLKEITTQDQVKELFKKIGFKKDEKEQGYISLTLLSSDIAYLASQYAFYLEQGKSTLKGYDSSTIYPNHPKNIAGIAQHQTMLPPSALTVNTKEAECNTKSNFFKPNQHSDLDEIWLYTMLWGKHTLTNLTEKVIAETNVIKLPPITAANYRDYIWDTHVQTLEEVLGALERLGFKKTSNGYTINISKQDMLTIRHRSINFKDLKKIRIYTSWEI